MRGFLIVYACATRHQLRAGEFYEANERASFGDGASFLLTKLKKREKGARKFGYKKNNE